MKIGMIALMIFISTINMQNQPEEFLKKFYTHYIYEYSQPSPNLHRIEKLKSKYSTRKFLLNLENKELEADPFLNTQDIIDKNWLSNISIKTVDSFPNLFNVCLETHYYPYLHCVRVEIKKHFHRWKIDNIRY